MKKTPNKTAAPHHVQGLRYVSDAQPGIHRLRRSKSFYYVDARGRKVTNAETLERIRKLAIPPAYEQVWICEHEHGHLQATGIDARGRKQYRYHSKWRKTRDAYKFTKMAEFGAKLPTLRRRLKRDLALPGLPKQKVLALVVTLLQETKVRVGNEEYKRQNHSYGLTTLRDWHVKFFGGDGARLKFRGKSGKEQLVELKDHKLASIIHRCHDLPDQHLFQYVDEQGQHQPIDSSMVNDYLHEIMGAAKDGTDFTAKDFRTWGATLAAIRILANMPIPPNAKPTPIKRCILEVCEQVAEQLGNTPAICRKSYINPWVFTAWSRDIRPKQIKALSSRRAAEQHALRLLRLQARHEQIAL